MFQEIISRVKDKKVVLFGEVHGTREIPSLLSEFFKELSPEGSFNLCLEIPDEFQEQIDSFMDDGDYDILRKISFFSKECCSDGRNSLEYMNLIKTIYDINSKLDLDIKIFCVSPSQAKNQEEAEKGLASNILKTTDNKKTFAVVGNIHASKKEIDFFKQKIVPAGFLLHKELGDNMYSILITAKKGEIFNNGLRKIKSSKNDPFETNFDYVIRLEKVTHCSFL